MNKPEKLITLIHKHLMSDYSCHTVSFIINAYEKSVNKPFKQNVWAWIVFFIS